MRRHIAPAAFAAALLAVSTPASSQNLKVEGNVEFNLLKVEGLVVGKRIAFDNAKLEEHGIKVPLPFSILVPTADDVLELLKYAPSGPGGAIFKLNFATEDRQLIENFQIVPMRLGEGNEEQRTQALVNLLAETVYPKVVEGSLKNSRDIMRKTKIGDFDAIEIIGRYENPELGLMYTRIVGIPGPQAPHGIIAIGNVVAAKQPLGSPEDFPRTRGGTALRHLKFIE